MWRAHDGTDGETVTVVRTRLKMAATLTVVVLALTGFQSSTSSGGSGGGSGKSRSGDGGGCSSSDKKNDDYSGSSGSTSSGSSGSSDATEDPYTEDPYTEDPYAEDTEEPTADGGTEPAVGVEVVVLDCVKPARKKSKGRPAREADTSATLKITPYDWRVQGTFEIAVHFEDANGKRIETDLVEVSVEGVAKEAEAFLARPETAARVKHCTIGWVRRS
ncbi:hypothetical protein [Streptomyces sp. NPDC058486]|uniref:hypothetical protein n=1 Tax=unclassified Streptomyces TaxID=2593676 RepID=UPI00364FCD62